MEQSKPLQVPQLPNPPLPANFKRKNNRVIPPEKRKKVAQACDNCKKKKLKCDGLQPCYVCTKRDISCQYTKMDKRLLKPTNKELEHRRLMKEQEEMGRNMMIPVYNPLQQAQFNYISDHNHHQSMDLTESSPTFDLLRYCRKFFILTIGSNSFSDDVDVENIFMKNNNSKAPLVNITDKEQWIQPSKVYADYLLKTFLNNVNNIVYVIDDQIIREIIEKQYSNGIQISQEETCFINLLFAVSSIFAKFEIITNLFPFPSSYFINPEIFLNHGLSILYRFTNVNVNNESLIVESYFLISLYYQFLEDRSKAWIKLGDAIRYAQSIGMHRNFVNESFQDPTQILHRRKLFRSLYFMDLISSLNIKRPLGINLQDWDDLTNVRSINDFQKQIFEVSILDADILNKIYYNRSMNSSNLLEIFYKFKNYLIENPISKQFNHSRPLDHKYFIPYVGYTHGLMLFSINFFQLVSLNRLNMIKLYDYNDVIKLNNLKLFYKLCINSSLLNIKIIEYVYYQNIHPFKPLTLISSLFQAGLIICVSLFLRSKTPNDESLDDINIIIILKTVKISIDLLKAYSEVDILSLACSETLQKMLNIIINNDSNLSYISNGIIDRSNIIKDSITENEKKKQEIYQDILQLQDSLFPNLILESNLLSLINIDNNSIFDEISKLNNFTNLNNDDLFFDNLLNGLIGKNSTNNTSNLFIGNMLN